MAMLYLRNKPIGAISSGASGGGHTIENPSGTDMTQRSNLQFTDADVSDDSTNDRTEISIVRELTQAEFDELTSEEQNRGVIVIKDANPSYLPADNSVSVVSDGVKTYSQLLDELYALADQSKISKDSCLAINKEYHRLTDLRGIDYSFAGLNGQSLLIVRVKLRASNSAYEILSPNYSNASSSVPTSGATITLYYNIISTGLDVEISPQKIAEVSANQTYAAQLTALQTAFSALSASQKLKSYLVFHGGYIARYSNSMYDLHTCFEVASTGFVATQISITNAKFRTYNGSTTFDGSSSTDASPMELWV